MNLGMLFLDNFQAMPLLLLLLLLWEPQYGLR
jgi:hypothetical protein